MLMKRMITAALAVAGMSILGQTAFAGAAVTAEVAVIEKQGAGKAESTFTLIKKHKGGGGGGGKKLGGGGKKFDGGGGGKKFSGGGGGGKKFGGGGGKKFSGGGGGGRRHYGRRRGRGYGIAPLIVIPLAIGAAENSCYANCRQVRGPRFCRRYWRRYC